MRVKIRGKYYDLRFVSRLKKKHDGDCDAPHIPDKAMRVLKGQAAREELDAIIHELLHAGLWDIDEDAVLELATDMAAVLHDKLGYRKAA